MQKYECCGVGGRAYLNLIFRAVELKSDVVFVSFGVRDDKYDNKDFIVYRVMDDEHVVFYRRVNNLDLDKLDIIIKNEFEELKKWGLSPVKDVKGIISID